ncbi:MAG: efflux RND transporter permease subunit [Acidobacteria bacterium]|nr:efflux RND transporter permease subunit [Acidobacteriota bacterium]
MNLAEFSIKRRTTTLVLIAVALIGGVVSFNSFGRLEDPEFTIKVAVVMTPYPGASPREVEEEVTGRIEEAIQAMGQLKQVRSISRPGLSIVYAEMQEQYDKATLPQVWDELRRKVGDVQSQLPPGVLPSVVNDDFGDTYGVFLGLTGEGYSYAELWDIAKFLKRELLLVTDVAKVAFWGQRPEAVYVEMSRTQMSQLGISPQEVFQTLGMQNQVANSGRVHVGEEFIRVQPSGLFSSVEDLRNLLIRGRGSENLIYLRDVATIRRGYQDPPTQIMTIDGKPAIGIGISTRLGGNAVVMGEGVEKRLRELEAQIPAGMSLVDNVVSYQSQDVTKAINGFVVNLLEALIIVIVVLMIFMGWRSAVLIGLALLISIVATFVLMGMYAVSLERISLGALIIALGMLVDNAIVVTEGILVGSQKGRSLVQAAIDTVGKQSMPLLGATAVAILAFAAIGVSQDSTGEYCRSLFQVILFSLGLSWLVAVTATPLLGSLILKPEQAAADVDPYAGRIFQIYRRALDACVRRRVLTLGVVLIVFVLSLWGFGFVDQSFFPDSTRAQFYVEFWRPEGSHIQDTARDVAEIGEWIRSLDHVTSTASFSGQGPLRFLLTLSPEDVNSAYGVIMVSVDDYRRIDDLRAQIDRHVADHYSEAQGWTKKLILGPGGGAKIEAQFSGPNRRILRQLAEQAKSIMREDPGAVNIRDDWRQPVKVIVPVYAETPARVAGVTRPDLAGAIEMAFEGRRVGVYREEDDLLPIIARAPQEERSDVYNMNSVQVWSSGTNRAVPFSQVTSTVQTVSDDNIIRRLNRMRAIKAQADQAYGTSEALRSRIAPAIEAIQLPPGYQLDWKGEYESSRNGQAALASKIPPIFLFMILVVILLFDRLKQPAIIYLTVPLAIIGVTVGLLMTKQPFGFMALLGILSLSGMLIKNSIVLIDETDGLIREGMDPYEAVVQAGVSRSRPVAMAALTTMLGMMPLLQDAFFVAMAVTIVFGLGFATILTLIVVPVLYAVFFRIPNPDLTRLAPQESGSLPG